MVGLINYQELDWDSNFFGFKVAIIEGITFDEIKLYTFLNSLKRNGVELVYISLKEEIKAKSEIFMNFEVIFVDEKVTYLKVVDNNESLYEKNIVKYDLEYPTEQMLRLAIQSGKYSRFNVDNRIGRKKFEELYTKWMINSVNQSIAKNTLIYRVDDAILGMVTLSEKNGKGDIGIIAVDERHRGKGIGKALMNAAEKWTYDNRCSKIQVVTQGFNIPACKLYESRGFSKNKIDFFYHCWLKNK